MQAEPLILLPGTLRDEGVWPPVRERLDWPAQVLPLTGGTTKDAMAAAVLRQAPERFVLGGFSLGGIVALELVARACGEVGPD